MPFQAPDPAQPDVSAVSTFAHKHRPRRRGLFGGPNWWIWPAGGGLAVLLVLGVVGWWLFGPNSGTPVSRGGGDGTRTFAPVDAAPEEIRDALEKELKVTGSVTPRSKSETLGFSTSTYQQWDLDLTVANNSSFGIELGNDLILVEASTDGATFDGVAQFRGRIEQADRNPDSGLLGSADLGAFYGLSNFESRYTNGKTRARRGSVETVITPASAEHGAPTDDPEYLGFGVFAPGSTRKLETELDQGTWLKEEFRASVRVALPELRIRTHQGIERYRLVVYFAKPSGEGEPWKVSRTSLVPMDADHLAGLVTVPETNLVTRLLAANWLADVDAAQAGRAISRAAQGLEEGTLLACCLRLMRRLEATGLEEWSVQLLDDEETPNGIRRLAALYLGAVEHQPSADSLIAAAKEDDDVVAKGAITALGDLGGPKAAGALTEMLGDEDYDSHEDEIVTSLARTGDAEGIRVLEGLAEEGNRKALSALVDAGLPETFGFFQRMLAGSYVGDWQSLAVQGLRKSGGEKAIPVLIELLEDEEPPDADEPLQTTVVVDELIALSSPQAVPRLAELAREGNLRALQALAGQQDPSAREPLAEIAHSAGPAGLQIALDGLADHWAEQSTELFERHLGSSNGEIVLICIRGLGRGGANTVPLLLPLLTHQDEEVRRGAADALEHQDPGEHVQQYLDAILRTDEDQVAVKLVSALIDHDWQDRKAIPSLAEKLRTSEGDMRFQIIRLLRHLSGDAMGPDGYSEFSDDADAWTRKWLNWAEQQ